MAGDMADDWTRPICWNVCKKKMRNFAEIRDKAAKAGCK
jgi:hypothetical protein